MTDASLPAAGVDEDDLFAFAYALGWRAAGSAAGAHRSGTVGGGSDFHDFTAYERAPDGRRIDPRATARDPFGRLQVRRYKTRNRIGVEMIVDASGSMGFRGDVWKPALAGRLAAAVALAARRNGDRFGLTVARGGDTQVLHAPGPAPAAAAIDAAIAGMVPSGRGTAGLEAAAAALPPRRRLVFLVSDFRFPRPALDDLADRLAIHDVVPVELADPAEVRWPRWGLGDVADLETGARRMVLFRPALARRLSAAETERRAGLAARFAELGRRPFRVEGRLDLAALAAHLLEV